MSTHVTIVTHAVTDWHIKGKTQGHIDTPLNSYGKKMAELLSIRLKNENLNEIYSSDLKRAYETAEPLVKELNINLNRDRELREGRWKVKDTGEYPLLPWNVSNESLEELKERIVAAITNIAVKNNNKKILIVSHDGAVKMFIEELKSLNCAMPKYKNIRGAINQFIYNDGKWECILLNDGAYLKNIPLTSLSLVGVHFCLKLRKTLIKLGRLAGF